MIDRRCLLRDSTLALGAMALAPRTAAVPAAYELRRMRRKDFSPAYLSLHKSGVLAERDKKLRAIFTSCRLCPRACGVNRAKGGKGVCQSTARLKVYGSHPHYGEERPLVGSGGSGTIFFSHCNLLCLYCQNWEINHRGDGDFVTEMYLARMMVALQERGCHNINLVTPTHVVPNIVTALRIAIPMGLSVPLVYNTGGYDSLEVIRLLDGIVDIYLPDYKYTDGENAAGSSSGARDYPEVAAAVIAEMHRQVGELTVDERGVALRGLIIRHLVLPRDIAGSEKFVKWVAQRLSPTTYVNIMAQYHPAHRAREFEELNRRITSAEYQQALAWARQSGLVNLD